MIEQVPDFGLELVHSLKCVKIGKQCAKLASVRDRLIPHRTCSFAKLPVLLTDKKTQTYSHFMNNISDLHRHLFVDRLYHNPLFSTDNNTYYIPSLETDALNRPLIVIAIA